MPRLLSDFVPDVRARGPYDAPQNVTEDAVRRTAIDLCEQAGVWTFEYSFFQQDNVSDYPIYIPEFTRAVTMDWVQIGKQRYQPFPNNNCGCQCGPFSVTMPTPKIVRILPAPWPHCQLSEVTVKLWLTPMQEACELPEILWQRYSDTIANGAAARLLATPKQSYTNMGLSRQLYAMYVVGKTQAKNQRVMQHTTGPLLMRGSYF